MLRNTDVVEGYKPRPYPTDRAGRKPVTFAHVHKPEGRVFLIYVLLVAEDLLRGSTSVHMDRDFKSAGLSAQKLFDTVMTRTPEYPGFYASMTGKQLTPAIVYNRWHNKAVYQNGKPGKNTPTQSREHYLASKRLRGIFPRVEKRYREGGALTLLEMRELGS